MATKSDNKLSQAKKEVFRTKEKLAQKFGKARGYNDAEFETLWKRCEDHFQLLDNIKKFMEGYVRSLTALCVSEVKLSDDVAVCFAPKDQMYEAALRNKDTIGLLDAHRAEYDRVIRDDFLACLADYLRQAGTLKRRKNERDRRKIDMDRYKHDYQRNMEKGDHTQAMQNKRKYGGMKVGFEALNAEMINDIPLFINDRDAFFQPLFARFLIAQADFYSRASELYKDLLPCFQHIDRLSVHNHEHVITDEEVTCSNETIDLTKPVDRDELAAERSNYRSVAAGGAPSSTGYMSQMGHAPPGSNVLGKPLPPSSVNTMSRGSYGNAPPQQPHRAADPIPQPYYSNQQSGQTQYQPPQQQGYPPPQQQQQRYPAPPQQQNQGGYQPQQPLSVQPPPQTAPHQPKKVVKKKVAKKYPKKYKQKGVKKAVKKAVPPGPAGGGGRPMPGGPGGGGGGGQRCRALYPFQGQDQTELTFQAGDVIMLTRCDPGQDWWEGQLNGRTALLPANYVEKF